MFNKIKEKYNKFSKENTLESLVDLCNKKITEKKASESIETTEEFLARTSLKTVIDCPYLEKKCADLPCPCPKHGAWELMQKDPAIIERKIRELGIDPTKDSWTVMMGMQKIFASRFHNTVDMTKDEKDHWIKEYLICIEDEVAEMLDHVTLPLATKLVELNQVELNKEIVDILHFVMDTFIAGGATADDIKYAYLKYYSVGVTDVSDLLAFAVDQQLLMHSYSEQTRFDIRDNGVNEIEIIMMDLAIRLQRASRDIRQQISWKHWKKPNAEINQEKLMEAYADLFYAFIDLVIFNFDSAEELKNVYTGKNVENILRQELGY